MYNLALFAQIKPQGIRRMPSTTALPIYMKIGVHSLTPSTAIRLLDKSRLVAFLI